jgi:hypothetical protein
MPLALKVIRLVLTWPSILIGWGYVLLLTVVFVAHRWSFDKENLVLSAVWRPWVTKFWRYSTTISRGIIYHPAAVEDTRIREHEMVHVRQVEDCVLLSLVLGAVAATLIAAQATPFFAFLGFWVAGVAFQLPNFLGAVLRGGHVYRDAEHERSAYAQTDLHHTKDKSWLEDHLSRPRNW